MSSNSLGHYQDVLDDIVRQVRPLVGEGRVADYIPALAEVCPDQVGIAIFSLQQGLVGAGDADQAFSIQSISKLFALALAMDKAPETLWQRVGREPSGQAFNSLVQLETEQGIPRNPFINAGAIVVCDILESTLNTPCYELLTLLRRLSGNRKIISDARVSRSEYLHSARNAAMAYLMKSFGNLHNDVDRVLKAYFHNCALKMSCKDLAKACGFLANRGECPVTGETILGPQQTKQLNALMATSGLYQGSGNFAYRVGLPGKSGVGGGIVAVVPNEMTVCVYSPELDEQGNSLAGIAALEQLSTALSRSVF